MSLAERLKRITEIQSKQLQGAALAGGRMHHSPVHHTAKFYASHPHYHGAALPMHHAVVHHAPVHHALVQHPMYHGAALAGGKVAHKRAPKRTAVRVKGGALAGGRIGTYAEYVKYHYHPVRASLEKAGYHGRELNTAVLREIGAMWKSGH